MTVLVRLGAVESRRFGFELVKPSSVVVSGGSASATVSALGSVEFTTCETLSLNGVFQSGYDNYMIVMRHVSSTQNAINGRWRVGGTDASGSNYVFQAIDAGATTVSGDRQTSQTQFRFANSDSANRSGTVNFVYGPALAQPTAARNVSARGVNGAQITDFASTHSLSTAYDGITLICSSGTFSGRVAVYGMRG